jgi:Zn finger protein HypA/HybF involved in hydrogenase expression
MPTTEEIQKALIQFPNHKTLAARSLGISLTTYTHHLKRLGLNTPARSGPKSGSSSYRTEQDLQKAVQEGIQKYPLSMRRAAEHARMRFGAFSRIAGQLGIFKPNKSGKGVKRPDRCSNVLDALANGSKAGGANIKARLIRDGHKKDICEVCGQLPEWNGRILSLQLDHVDGDHQNNSIENLRIICPNCHTQTDTFSSRKGPRGFRSINSVELQEVQALVDSGLKLAGLIRSLNLNPRNMPARQKLKDLVERLQSKGLMPR